jgi:amino acid transporter
MGQAVWASVLAISGTYDQLTDYVIFASWIFYALVTSAVFVLRRTAPDAPRPYRTLGYPIVPVAFVLVAACCRSTPSTACAGAPPPVPARCEDSGSPSWPRCA